jgi:ferredoxin
MKIVYNFKKCVGCGLCVLSCPDIWAWGEDGQARFKKPTEVSEDQEVVLVEGSSGLDSVVSGCPVQAIKLEE